MRWLESRILWGSLLILGGILFLLQNLGIFQGGSLFWALLLGLAGLFFLSIFFTNRANWWGLIPGFTLLSVALLIMLQEFVPRFTNIWGGSLVLGSIGLSFLAIYLVDRNNWWAVIPGGVLLTLTVVAGASQFLPGFEMGGILFLGLGLTFTLVAIIPTPPGSLRWAWLLAGVLILMGLLFLAATGQMIGLIWPLALIVVGGYLILRTFRPRMS